jgi:gas vesicle protein
MKYPKTDNTLSLLAGAAVGAVAMYLLDPEAGERRRHRIAEAAGDASHSAGAAVGPILDRMTDTARSVGSTLAGQAGALGQGISDKWTDLRRSDAASGVSDRVSHLGDHAADIASSWRDSLRSAGSRARSAASSYTPHVTLGDEGRGGHAGAYAATGIGTLLVGAGLMYFLDPQRGRQRRASAISQAEQCIRGTGRIFNRAGRQFANRAKGYAHDAQDWFTTEDAVSAEQLLQRVRSEIGHVVSHSGAIQVMTDNQGRVTLHGKVLASEADKLVSTVKRVGGVTELINLLSVKETEQQMQESQTSPTGQAAPQL